MLGKVVLKTGETVRVWGILYKSVAQYMFLYGSQSWMVAGAMLEVLEMFHHWVARGITGRKVQSMTDGECEWPPVVEALEIFGLWTIKEYIHWNQDIIAA